MAEDHQKLFLDLKRLAFIHLIETRFCSQQIILLTVKVQMMVSICKHIVLHDYLLISFCDGNATGQSGD